MVITVLSNGVVEVTNKLIIDYRARDWCKLPYTLHPKGCPNFNHKPTCPPRACFIENLCNLSKRTWFVIVSFDLQSHINKMLSKYPDWTDRQTRCVLYWQPKVNKQLENETKLFCAFKPLKYTTCPEAMGVNVIKTAKQLGLPITPRPKNKVYKIALVAEI